MGQTLPMEKQLPFFGRMVDFELKLHFITTDDTYIVGENIPIVKRKTYLRYVDFNE
jgi:hypothetical protein